MTSWPDHLPSGDRKRFFEIARVFVHLDYHQKAARFGKSCGFYWSLS
jgi:hypothetical protein